MKTKQKFVLGIIAGVLLSFQALAAELWVDVRTAEEYATGHHPQAINIPYTEIGQKIAEFAESKDQPINLYCRSGRRAGIAKETLEKLGYSRVSNLGGYSDVVQQ